MPGVNVKGIIANEVAAVTASDSSSNLFSYLFIGVGGDVAVLPENSSSSVVFKNVPTGSYLWVRTSKVLATNTTATNILGCS